jgi:hypothetical protein
MILLMLGLMNDAYGLLGDIIQSMDALLCCKKI